MKRFVWLFSIVVLVAGLWSIGWLLAADQVKQSIDQLAANDGAGAPKVTCGTLTVSGFPFRIDVGCDDAVVVAEDVTVTAGGFRASVQVDNLTHVVFSARGPVTTADAFYGSSTRLDFSSLQGSARVLAADIIKGLGGDGWRIARLSLVGEALNWVDTIGTELPLAKSSHAELQVIDVPELHNAANGTAALAIYGTAKDVTAQFYGIGNGNGEVQLQVTGLPDDLRRFDSPTAIADWQAAGGKVEVMRVNGTDGEDLIDASGTLALDANHMVEGDIAYVSRGIKERVAPYVNNMVLSVLAGLPQADGTFKQTLQFAGGSMRIAGIPLFNLEPLY